MFKKRMLLLLSEKSTYSGLVAFLAGASIFGLDEGMWQQIAGLVAAIAGTISMLTLDNGDRDKLGKK